MPIWRLQKLEFKSDNIIQFVGFAISEESVLTIA